MSNAEHLKTFLLNGLVEDELKDLSAKQEENTSGLVKILVQKRLFSSSPLTEQPEVEPWLRSRLLESTVAYVGVLRYVNDLLSYDGKKPERDVQINSYLAAAHVSSSLNRLICDTLMRLRRDKRLNLTVDQLDDLSRVLNPSRTFIVPELKQNFDPILVEDIRSSVQRLVWDEFSRKKEYVKKSEIANATESIPRDLVQVGLLPELSTRDLLNLTLQFSSFGITIKEGCLIWSFEGAPTMYIVGNRLFYSPRQSREFTKTEIEKQATNITRILRKVTERRPSCGICGMNDAQELAFTKDGTVRQVCNNCSKSPLVWRIIYSGDPKTAK